MSETDTEYAHAIIRTATRWFYFVVTVVSDKMLYRAEVKKRMLLKNRAGNFQDRNLIWKKKDTMQICKMIFCKYYQYVDLI